MRRQLYAAALSLAFIIMTVSGASWLVRGHDSTASVSANVQVMPTVPSASDVASSLNCGRFKDFPATNDGEHTPLVLDSGTCWIGKKKYGINTFVSPDTRNSWLKLAESEVGVNPKWEASDWVVYPSVSSTQA